MENMLARDRDEELSLFLEMRRLEKAHGVSSLLEPGRNSVDQLSTKSLVLTTTSCVQQRKSAVEKFLDSENNKSDYDWLLAAPETVGEKEVQEKSMVQLEKTKPKLTALKLRVENIQQEPVTSKQIPKLNPSTGFSKQANTVAEPKPKSKPSRKATPTSRTTLPSTRQTNSAQITNQCTRTTSVPRASSFTRSSSVGKSAPSAKTPSPTITERRPRPVSTSRSRVYSSGDRSMERSKISNDVNPVLLGTQMVERVVNMRKLPPPKQDDNLRSGFGRSLSRSSLDMALRHMNIRHNNLGNLRVTINAPTTNSIDKK